MTMAKKVWEQVNNLDKKVLEQDARIKELEAEKLDLISLCLWSARRSNAPCNKKYVYDEVDNITGEKCERV